MTEEEQKKHNDSIETILELMEEQGLKQIYKTNKNSVEFLYFSDVED